MDDATFWALVTDSGKGRTCAAGALELQRRLEVMPTDDVRAFDATFTLCHLALYTWDLWGVAYILNGGCSDDGFEYFCAWVIGRGKESFALARDDPEAFGLTLHEADRGAGRFACEELLYVAANALQTLGVDPGPSAADPDVVAVYRRGPAGEKWDETPQSLVQRFPRLARKWGVEP